MKKKKEKKEHIVKEQVANVLNLPHDLVLGKAILSFIGNTEIYIENYKGISEFNTNEIKVETKTGFIQFKGRNLSIHYYTTDEMKIIGTILEVKFE